MTVTFSQALASSRPSLRISADAADRTAHARDWWPRAAKWTDEELDRHRPDAVVFATGEEDCIAVVAACRDTGTKLVTYGAGSGVVGAAVPDSGSVVIDMRGMSRIVAFNATDGFVTVEPGCLGGELENWLNERGFTLGHYPQSLHLASIGGLISTRSTGTFSNKYGGIEELVLALRVVGADGSVTAFRNTPRNSSGPALQQLFIGAEGTLGVITQATLRVFPRAERRIFEGYQFPSVAAGVEAVRKAYAAHLRPAVLRLYDETEAANLYRRVGRDSGPPLLIAGFEGLSGVAAAEQAAFAAIAKAEGGISLGPDIGNAWEAHRFDANWLTAGNEGPRRMADAIEIALPWSTLAEAHAAITAEVAPYCATVMSHYSHFYSTGGALYVIVLLEGADTASVLEQYRQVWDRVMRKALAFGGSLAHHHGVGRQRAPFLPQELDGGHRLLQLVKAALDPEGILNPGKLALNGAVQ
ncbi:FAD-binding oxidoreductase [Methylobacterium nodulans]|uniref:FAD linked oxidase domain protein n=1 Tax=Methylobacterium nodulans (strain LMG 21967 / CNCM I-2342 / ORS 2060) TaxID=460265 RepID=B8IXF0_METNO|nr:FAD-binding oxidoreductase [Methylobacterium nodulans]ACL63191.1 FAD linked oxidase domain protein [Methylobacterium nodulans ORS 2060]